MSSLPPPTASASLADHDALPAGTRFGELEIVRVLGVGGFGIVYLARDHALERHVALKEYMPASLATRGAGAQITVRSGSHAQTYAIGLRSFVNEARLLARFDHPSLVKVYRFWEDNGTAYMVMPYLQGRTLRDVRRAMSVSPSEAFIRSLLDALLSALDLLHREGVYHRDIAPDNILLPPEGPPILLDFGAARRVISDRTQTLTAILKPNYAPIEQYAEMTQLRQGPWTDLYALGAVVHFLLFGAPPQPATTRVISDELVSLPQRLVTGISPRLLATVAWMLAVRPQQRPQNVEALREVLDGRAPVPVLEAPAAQTMSDMTLPLPSRTEFPPTLKVDTPGSMGTPRASGVDAGVEDTVIRPASARSYRAAPAPMPEPAAIASRGWRRRAWVGVLGLAVVGAAVAVWQFGAHRTTPVVANEAASAPAAVARGPAVAAAPATPVEATAVAAAPALAASDAAVLPTGAAAAVAAPPPPPASPPVADGAEPSTSPPTRLRGVTHPPARAAALAVRRAPAAQAPADDLLESSVAADPPRSVAAAAAPAAAGPEGPATAREACGRRVFLALWTCMDRECERPRFRDQPDCLKVLEVKRRRSQ